MQVKASEGVAAPGMLIICRAMLASASNRDIGVGRYDQSTASVADLGYLICTEHRTCADQHVIAKLFGDAFDTVERVWRVEVPRLGESQRHIKPPQRLRSAGV